MFNNASKYANEIEIRSFEWARNSYLIMCQTVKKNLVQIQGERMTLGMKLFVKFIVWIKLLNCIICKIPRLDRVTKLHRL